MKDAPDPRTTEQRLRDQRVLYGGASVDDHLAFALDELRRANDLLPPSGKTGECPDGYHVVGTEGCGYHVSACVQRAMSSVMLVRRMQAGEK